MVTGARVTGHTDDGAYMEKKGKKKNKRREKIKNKTRRKKADQVQTGGEIIIWTRVGVKRTWKIRKKNIPVV